MLETLVASYRLVFETSVLGSCQSWTRYCWFLVCLFRFYKGSGQCVLWVWRSKGYGCRKVGVVWISTEKEGNFSKRWGNDSDGFPSLPPTDLQRVRNLNDLCRLHKNLLWESEIHQIFKCCDEESLLPQQYIVWPSKFSCPFLKHMTIIFKLSTTLFIHYLWLLVCWSWEFLIYHCVDNNTRKRLVITIPRCFLGHVVWRRLIHISSLIVREQRRKCGGRFVVGNSPLIWRLNNSLVTIRKPLLHLHLSWWDVVPRNCCC